jgi:hypothetical protein
MAAGIVFLALPLVQPHFFFPLIWGSLSRVPGRSGPEESSTFPRLKSGLESRSRSELLTARRRCSLVFQEK